MSRTLIASEQSIAKIFSDDYVFTIPSYQRPYSWGTEQAAELFDDLMTSIPRDGSDLAGAQPYFLGSIVLIKQESVPHAEVVDGQQRLTTLTLLLSAIRANVSHGKARDGLSRLIYEPGDIILNTDNHYRLALRDRDREFFRDYVQQDDGITRLVAMDSRLPDSRHSLRENARLFMDRLFALDETIRIRLAQFIATRCYLVTVATPDLDSAYRIFDVLNSRGLDLSATDILKAEIIGKIRADKRETCTRRWEDLEEDLGRDDFGALFSNIRMIYRKSKPKGTLLKEFRDHVRYASPEAFMDTILTPLANAYREIAGADYSSVQGAETVNETLKWLNRIPFADWMPPALVFLSRHRDEPEQIARFFRDLERLVYGMLICRWGVNERVERCSRLTDAVEMQADLWGEGAPLQLTIHEKKAIYDALNGPLYATHSARTLSLILLRLDAWLSGGGASYDFNIVTIEHVLPQNPAVDSQWMQWFPDESIRQGWVNRLGNLALLTRRKNSSAGNREFDWKKKSYFTRGGVTPFTLTTQVLAENVWTADVLQRLQETRLQTFVARLGLEDRADMAQAPSLQAVTPVMVDIDELFYCKGSEADGVARCSSKGMIVLKGSTGRAAVVDSLRREHWYQEFRVRGLEQGTLVETEAGRIRFEQDQIFKSPSAAAVAVMGRTANGWIEWKDAQGRTLRDVCRQRGQKVS
ncbi:MAG TPA: DUF4357 domain-containing protein [Rhodanobacteraceae bacterium]